MIVVVEGRGVNNSKGINAKQSAAIMQQLGCNNAVGLDGGGSSLFWYNGSAQSKSSDHNERPIGSALFVYTK